MRIQHLIALSLTWTLSQILFAKDEAALRLSHSTVHYLNEVSLVEPAGSKGSWGHYLGLVYSKYKMQTYQPTPSSENTPFTLRETNLNTAGFVYLHGTPWPIDIGVGLEKIQFPTSFYKGSAMIQGTLYEEFGHPSLSVRLFNTQFWSQESTSQARNTAVEWATAYSPIRYLKIYTHLRTSFHQSSLGTEPENTEGLSLWIPKDQEPNEQSVTHRTWTTGLHSNLGTAYFRLAAETDLKTSTPEYKNALRIKLTTIW